ncbi:MAG TPA: alkaline phosphatase family protein [Terriglobales bacterium]|nr:alkaline phosphatase family protein [Terriglobales bacterium]
MPLQPELLKNPTKSTKGCLRFLLAAWLVMASGAAPVFVHAENSPRAIVLAWDGAPSAFVQGMLRQGKLPHLAKLIEGGSFAESVTPVFPSKTAPGFATLWTGAPPRTNGISGNRIPREPRSEHTILESISAFISAPLLAEPIWASALRAGKKVVLSHVPFGRENSGAAVKFQGYDNFSGRDGIVDARISKPRRNVAWSHLPDSMAPPLEISFTIGLSTFWGLFVDDPTDGQTGYDMLLVTGTRDGHDIKASLKSRPSGPGGLPFWSPAIEVETAKGQRASSYLRLFSLASDGSDFLLYFTRPTRELVSFPGGAVFVGNGASLLYSRGKLGVTLPHGGNGTAEERYLETVRFAQHQLAEANRRGLKHLSWDLFFAYTPFPDEANHVWYGYLNSNLPGFNQEVAAGLRPYLEQVYQMSDDLLGLFMAMRPDNTIIALVSDHGVEGVSRRLAINQLLRRSGLLRADERGRIDLTRTRVYYPSINNGYLLINSTDRKGGIVPPDEREAIIKQVRDLAAEVGDDGKQMITAVYDARSFGEKMGIGGKAGGDIYLDILPGYDFESRVKGEEWITRREPYGMHGFNPERPSMHTIMVFNGPGIAAGKRLYGVRLVDFAPTLAKLVDIPTPNGATGRILQETFTDRH